jgi:hypothetical protein
VTWLPLPPAVRRDLLDLYRRTAEPDVRLRAHILLRLDAGYPWATISGALFCSAGTTARWKRRFEADGTDAVFGRPRGRRRSGVHLWAALGRPVGVDPVAHRLPVRPQSMELRGGSGRPAGGLPGAGRAGGGAAPAAGRRAGVAAAPPGHPPDRPGPREEASGSAGAAQGPPGGRDGGVHGRGGREPEPEGRVHVDAAGPAGGRRDPGDQPAAVPGREHPLADRAGHPDRRPPERRGGPRPCSAGTWTTCGGRCGTTGRSTSPATTPAPTRPSARRPSGRTRGSGGTG